MLQEFLYGVVALFKLVRREILSSEPVTCSGNIMKCSKTLFIFHINRVSYIFDEIF